MTTATQKPMDITIIDKGNIRFFKELLLPETFELLRTGAAVFALGALEDGAACGALAGRPHAGSFQITSFFVAQGSREKGAGTALLDELFRIAALQEELRALRCEFTIASEEHRLLAHFLAKHGFVPEQPENAVVSVSLASLKKLPYYRETQPSCRVYSFEELPETLLRAFDRRLTLEAGALFDCPLEQVPLDRACSMATIRDNAIDGCLLLEKRGGKLLSLSYADAGKAEGGGSFSSMLISAYRRVVNKYPEDTEVLIQPVTPLTSALVARLAPESRSVSRAASRPLR